MLKTMAHLAQRNTNEQPLAVVTGVGDGTGASVVHRFHNGGYQEGRLLLIRVPGPSLPENL